MNPRRKLLLAGTGFALAGCAQPGGAGQAARAAPGFDAFGLHTRGWTATPGGRGGRIVRVTQLGESGPGSLRAALEAEGARIVVFEVGGVIDMAGRGITIKHPFVTVAGHTAPHPGVTVVKCEVVIATHDVIVQHLIFRPGEFGRPKKGGGDQDGISSVGGAHDVIVDHCSFSWATDENLSASGPRFEGADPAAWRRNTSHRVTYSHNLIYEGLSHSVHEKGEHSKGSLIHDNTSAVLLLRNLYASNRERNALFKGGAQGAMVNNLIFNPGSRAVHYNLLANEWGDRAHETGRLTLLGNVYRRGPDTRSDTAFFTLRGVGDVALHLSDNLALDAAGAPVAMVADHTAGRARIVPLAAPEFPAGVVVLPAAQVAAGLPAAVGARAWDRDAIDARLLAEMASGVGRIIDSELDTPAGYPRYAPSARAFDPADWNLGDMSPRRGWAWLAARG